jgi:hypothetical protein
MGLVSVVANFGWFKCAVLYSDSKYGNSLSADFQQNAAIVEIKIALRRKFVGINGYAWISRNSPAPPTPRRSSPPPPIGPGPGAC